jgi:hypothetical protein
MAGNVFGLGRLPRLPAYGFQIFFRGDRHGIFRSPVLPDRAITDNAAANDTAFSAVEFEVGWRSDQTPLHVSEADRHWPLVAQLSAAELSGREWVLQFPIQHINIATGPHPQRLQVETGPILVPERLVDGGPERSLEGFYLASVFFTESSRADLLLFSRDGGHRGFRHFARLEGARSEIFR